MDETMDFLLSSITLLIKLCGEILDMIGVLFENEVVCDEVGIVGMNA